MANKHGHLTWRDLLDKLKELPEDRLEDTATVYDRIIDEFFPLDGFGVSKDGDPADGVLDAGHLYLEMDG